ncbi:MAG: hypothetical protein V7765_18860 [Oleispira sp.]
MKMLTGHQFRGVIFMRLPLAYGALGSPSSPASWYLSVDNNPTL